MVAGVGFFTDAYDLFAISIATVMLGYSHQPAPCKLSELRRDSISDRISLDTLSPSQDAGIKIATLVGTLAGQLVFGWLGDLVGRKRMCE